MPFVHTKTLTITFSISIILSIVVVGLIPFSIYSTNASSMQYILQDRIFEKGSEVVWRGGGGSYLFHASNFTDAWQQRLLDMQKMGLNTMRLAFAFLDSTPNSTTGMLSADVLDFAKMDWVIDFLSAHGIRAILDCHNYLDMEGDFGSQKLIDDWQRVAAHYKNDPRIVAYELFNEPYWQMRDPSVRNALDVAETYANLTYAVRRIDPQRIVIWESEPYAPPLEEIKSYLVPNMVFTFHRWWTQTRWEFQLFNVEQISYMSLAYAVEYREKLGVPFWFGEFGANPPFDVSNPEWLLTDQHLQRCEEQAIGWNLWTGHTGSMKGYLKLFSTNTFNTNLVRMSWNPPLRTSFTGFIAGSNDPYRIEPYRIELRHSDSSVTFNPGITVRVIRTHENINAVFEVVSDEQVVVTTQNTIRNEEGVTDYTGVWATYIYPIS